MKKPNVNVRTKFWTAVTYPESSDTEYLASCLAYARCAYAYILHDSDVWGEDDDIPEGYSVGDAKKPHVHWCIEFTTPHGMEYVCKLMGCPYAIPMKKDKQLSYRYLLHLDHPNKFQYKMSDISTNVSNIADYVVLDVVEPDDYHLSLMDAIGALACNAMSYRQFYSMFPHMLHKACVVATLVKQFSQSCVACGENMVTLPSGELAVPVRDHIAMVISNQ